MVYEHEISYREVYDHLLPILELSFELNGQAFYQLMLVDTGADKIALPAWSAERLGISLLDDCVHENVRSLGGPSEVFRYKGQLKVTIPDLDNDFSFSCSVLFAPALDNRSYGLLGRECALEHLAVGFYEGSRNHAFLLSLSPQLHFSD